MVRQEIYVRTSTYGTMMDDQTECEGLGECVCVWAIDLCNQDDTYHE